MILFWEHFWCKQSVVLYFGDWNLKRSIIIKLGTYLFQSNYAKLYHNAIKINILTILVSIMK